MQCKVNVPLLKTAIIFAKETVANKKKASLPVTSHLLLKLSEGHLMICSTDLSSSTRLTIPVLEYDESEMSFRDGICVEADKFSEYIKIVPSDILDLRIEGRTMKLKCTYGKSVSRFNGMPGDEFPLIREVSTSGFTLPTSDLLSAFRLVSFSAANKDWGGSETLTAINFSVNGDTLSMTTTDGFRLSDMHRPVSSSVNFSCLIPASASNSLAKMIRDSDSIGIVGDEKSVQFNFFTTEDNIIVSFTSQVINARYPDTQKLIPQHKMFDAWVDGGALRKALKTVMTFDTSKVQVGCNVNTLCLSTVRLEHGNVNIELDTNYIDGVLEKPLFISASYLNDVVSRSPADSEIHFGVAPFGGNRSVVIEIGSIGDNYHHVVATLADDPVEDSSEEDHAVYTPSEIQQ